MRPEGTPIGSGPHKRPPVYGRPTRLAGMVFGVVVVIAALYFFVRLWPFH